LFKEVKKVILYQKTLNTIEVQKIADYVRNSKITHVLFKNCKLEVNCFEKDFPCDFGVISSKVEFELVAPVLKQLYYLDFPGIK